MKYYIISLIRFHVMQMCFCFELGQRYLYYYNIFAFTIHKITVIGTDKNTQKQLKNLAAKNNSEPVKNTGTKVHYEFSNFFRHPNETAPLSLTSAHIWTFNEPYIGNLSAHVQCCCSNFYLLLFFLEKIRIYKIKLLY